MEFNSYLFPVPQSSYTSEDFKGELIWIPKKSNYTYRDKMKYNNYKSLIPKPIYSDKNNHIRKGSVDTIHSQYSSLPQIRNKQRYSTSFIQKIPSISFSFDNKFSEKEKEILSYIPCLYIRVIDKGSNKLLIYFHANYEDLGYTYSLCAAISKKLSINVLSVEYPKYGIYKSDVECSSDSVLNDADTLYRFLTEIMNIDENNLIVMGRCIGSGPATFLASKYNPLALILISPFKSIKAAVKSIFDKMKFGWVFEKVVKERFSNIDNIQKVKCPCLFIHGKLDDVIPWEHSLELINICNCAAKLVTPEQMKHNLYDIHKDVIPHIQEFFVIFSEEEKNENIDKNYYTSNDSDDSSLSEAILVENTIHFPLFMFSEPKV